MDWFKKHVDTMVILGSFAAAMIWMSAQFKEVDQRFSNIEKDIAIIKSVLVMKNIMPSELSCGRKEKL
jgi:hypothetical protein